MTTIHFADISDIQPESVIDWHAYAASSRVVALKSTEGADFTASSFAAHRANAIASGIERLLIYHFARPDINNPIVEANYQHWIVGAIRPQDVLVLDFEVQDVRATAEWAYQFLRQQEQNYGGQLPAIYASYSFVQSRLQDERLARYPLWLAAWTYDAAKPPACPPPWKSMLAWQYSDKATMAGIRAQVDANVFYGTITTTQPKEEEMVQPISLSTPGVSSFYEQAGAMWRCKFAYNPATRKMEPSANGALVGNAILTFYRSHGGSGLNGLTHLSLPLTPETGVAQGITAQVFERALVVFDPSHRIENPAGSGEVYILSLTHKLAQGILQHVFGLSDSAALQAQIDTLKSENQQLSTQVQTLSKQTSDIQLQAQLAQAQARLNQIEELAKL